MKVLLLLSLLLISSCISHPGPEQRDDLAGALAQQNGWHKEVISSGFFELATYLPDKIIHNGRLTIYIEGDGFSWVNSSRPSSNPTPVNPVGLRLALAHNEDNAVYLARPCQFVNNKNRHCHRRFWTGSRFATEVVESSSRAIDIIKRRFKARHLTLVGYSGGGAVAALLAARRNDVVRLITIAGNLDHHDWARYHNVTPLTGSLNPVDDIEVLEGIPQVHFVGAQDKIVSPEIAEKFVSRFSSREFVNIVTIPEYDHHCCWAQNWRFLWSKYLKSQ